MFFSLGADQKTRGLWEGKFFPNANMSSSHALAEKGSSLGEESFEKVNSYIKAVFDILKHEKNKVRKERDAFDEVAKKLEHVHFSKLVKLNVGGHHFSTSLETLTKDPGMFLTFSSFCNEILSIIQLSVVSVVLC